MTVLRRIGIGVEERIGHRLRERAVGRGSRIVNPSKGTTRRARNMSR